MLVNTIATMTSRSGKPPRRSRAEHRKTYARNVVRRVAQHLWQFDHIEAERIASLP